MRTFFVAGLLVSLSSFLRAAPDGINPPADTATASTTQTAAGLWTQIGGEGQQIMAGVEKHDAVVARLIPGVEDDLGRYLTNFPADAHVPEAKLMLAQIHDLAHGLHLPGAPTAEGVDQEFNGLAADASLPLPLRAEASLMTISSVLRNARADEAAQSAAGKGHSAQWDDVDVKVSDFEKNFGTVSFNGQNSAAEMLRGEQITLLQQAGDTTRLNALLTKLATDPHPDIAALAKQSAAAAQTTADLKKGPLDLKFTALDGSTVDLATLRGKVVLIDFWATWCGPCVGEVPNVVAAYQKYHDQGFEIVGISLDQDKAALQAFIKAKGMVWPQYFDGKGWSNDISSRFGIQAIPAMWLVAKDGIVVTQDGREDLAGQVQKLLAQ